MGTKLCQQMPTSSLYVYRLTKNIICEKKMFMADKNNILTDDGQRVTTISQKNSLIAFILANYKTKTCLKAIVAVLSSICFFFVNSSWQIMLWIVIGSLVGLVIVIAVIAGCIVLCAEACKSCVDKCKSGIEECKSGIGCCESSSVGVSGILSVTKYNLFFNL